MVRVLGAEASASADMAPAVAVSAFKAIGPG